MIPYQILMMRIEWADSLDVRIIDPLMDGVTFRLPIQSAARLKEKLPEQIVFTFLNYREQNYKKIVLKDFTIVRIPDTETESIGAVLFELHTSDEAFISSLRKILKDYETYIDTKLENDELQAMEEMTGVKVSEEYTGSEKEWQQESDLRDDAGSLLSDPANWQQALEPVEIAVSLDSFQLFRKFLELSWDSFIQYYWNENGLSRHPVSNFKITHLYIGNQFCPFLFPELSMLGEILDKAMLLQLCPVVVLSTMPEHLISHYKEVLKFLAGCEQKIEIVMNDIGILILANELGIASHVTFTAGILLNKQKKDIRASWRVGAAERNAAETDQGLSGTYQSYLKSNFGVNKISCDVTGYQMKLQKTGRAEDSSDTVCDYVLHLPAYQMNTAGYCTLYALKKYGDRGRQKQIQKCPHYCEDEVILYPKGTHILGRWNSLFGISMKEMNSVQELNRLIDQGVSRLVIRR